MPNKSLQPTAKKLRFLPSAELDVSLRKIRNIEAHVLFTGVYLLKRLFVGYTALGGRDIIHSGIANQQIAAGHRFQPGNHTQQGGFAAA